MNRIAPIVGIFDCHVPDHDTKLWRSWLDWCRDEKPAEVIIGGDFLELESCSEHGGVARPAMFKDEIDAGREALAEIRRANPNATLTYLEGNHETRLTRKVIHRLPDIDGAITIPEQLELKKLGIAWHKYGDVVKRGKLGFTHGWFCNEHHAAKHLRKAKCSLAYGHTHKPQIFTDGGVDGDVNGAFGMPCMRNLTAEWLNGQPSGWIQGFGVFYVMPNGNFTPYMVLAFDGQFVWNGKPYGGAVAANDDVEPGVIRMSEVKASAQPWPIGRGRPAGMNPRVAEACEQLTGLLSKGPRPSRSIADVTGQPAHILKQAKAILGIRSTLEFRDDGTAYWAWALPVKEAA